MTLDKKKADSVFVWAILLFDNKVRNQAKVSGGGAIMEGWNMGIIKALMLPLPPLRLQKHFRSIVEQIRFAKRKFKTAKDESEVMFRSLSQRAFHGDL